MKKAMTIREFIMEYLMYKPSNKELMLDVNDVYLKVKRHLDYIFDDQTLSEKPQEESDSFVINPYDILRRCNRYDFKEKRELIKFADTITLLLKMYYFILDWFYLKKDISRKAQYKMVYDLFDNIRYAKIDSQKWIEEIEKVYETIKTDPNSTIEIVTEAGLVKKIPIIESYDIGFSDIKCGFTADFKNNTGQFNGALQTRAYNHLKQNFIQVIEACWLVLTNNDILDIELSENEQGLWECIYFDIIKSSEENDEKESDNKKKKYSSSIPNKMWKKIDIKKERRSGIISKG